MEFKPVTSRPGADRAIRVVFALVVVILTVAAITERDVRTGASAVVIATFAAMRTIELPDRVDRAVTIVFWVAVVAWISQVIA